MSNSAQGAAAVERMHQDAVRTLHKIAAFSDISASEHLISTGSYGAFDEPGSVQLARDFFRRNATTIGEQDHD